MGAYLGKREMSQQEVRNKTRQNVLSIMQTGECLDSVRRELGGLAANNHAFAKSLQLDMEIQKDQLPANHPLRDEATLLYCRTIYDTWRRCGSKTRTDDIGFANVPKGIQFHYADATIFIPSGLDQHDMCSRFMSSS